MEILRLKDFVPFAGLVHIATTWEISETIDFVDPLVSEYTTEHLSLYYADVDIPDDTIYYMRAKRHFNDNTADFYTNPIELRNVANSYANMLLSEDVTIEEPYIIVDKAEILSNSSTFTVRTDPFRGSGDGHGYTHWIIKDVLGKVVFASLHDTVNKTSITVTKDTELASKEELTFIAIHGTLSCVESQPASVTVSLSNFNIELKSRTNNLYPLRGYDLVYTKVNPSMSARIYRITVYDANDVNTMLYDKYIDPNVFTIQLPWLLFKPNTLLYVDAYGYDTNQKFSKKRVALSVNGSKVTEIINKDYVYSKTIIKKVIGNLGINIANGTTTTEDVTGSAIVPINGSTLTFGMELAFTTTGNQLTKKQLQLTSLSSDSSNIYVKRLDNGMVFVDNMSSGGIPTFMVYQHDTNLDTYNLLHAKARPTDNVTTGINNAIYQISPYEFIYTPYNTNKIMKYDITTNVITEMNTIADMTNFTGTYVPIGSNQILLFGGDDFDAKVYNFKDNAFTTSTSTVPESFLNRNLKSGRLANGDTVIFKTDYDSNDVDTDVKYFNYRTTKFETLSYKFTPTAYPKSVIRSLSGECHLVNYGENDTLTFYTLK